ncbi:MAG: DNA-directed RNA polymerase subunit alpha [Chitinophagales bacterium]|nr:DNA-directed RNA polymerase subunit alpha [Bacteroidota bacterium]MCB9042870.1 DNA-directed RNA polymerase subunit alpha [Chitinophagales bacterium]
MGLLNFQKPDKINLQKADDFYGIFEFKPLEPGFGVTIGNSLRRVLLSSLEGYAITSIKISGVDHEFTTLKGVIEDIPEIILNLKQIRLKRLETLEQSGEIDKIFLSVSGKDRLVAGDIEQFTSLYEITNPELVICNMDASVKLEMELTIEHGRGYIPAEEHQNVDKSIGTIAIDSIYTPIKNVKYAIENTRVEQKTDYEKLIIEIVTDGTIHPEEAIKEAAKILIQHLMLISDEKITFDTKVEEEENVVDEHVLQMRKLLKTSLEDMDLSVRAYNCLKAAKINTLGELVQYDTNALMKFRNFGRKSMLEIEQLVIDKGLSFGMDLSKYKLDEE